MIVSCDSGLDLRTWPTNCEDIPAYQNELYGSRLRKLSV